MTDSFDIEVDRDSVAMGDDVQSHARRISVMSGTTLSSVLAEAAPEIRSRGWSWVAEVDGRTAAVWSIDRGVEMLVEDDVVIADNAPRRIFFRYFLQIDPEWLDRRLVDGAEANRRVLEREYQPIGDRLREEEDRRRERELPGAAPGRRMFRGAARPRCGVRPAQRSDGAVRRVRVVVAGAAYGHDDGHRPRGRTDSCRPSGRRLSPRSGWWRP